MTKRTKGIKKKTLTKAPYKKSTNAYKKASNKSSIKNTIIKPTDKTLTNRKPMKTRKVKKRPTKKAIKKNEALKKEKTKLKPKKSEEVVKEKPKDDKEQLTQKVIAKDGAVVDSLFPQAASYHVIKDKENNCFFSATLNKSSLDKNNNKFYILQLLQGDTSNSIRFFTHWGRVGVQGQTMDESCTLEHGITLYKNKLRDKIRGGYTEWVIDYSDDKGKEQTKPPTTQGKVKSKKKKSKPCLEEHVKELIKWIYNKDIMNEQMKEIDYDNSRLPLGKLGKETLMAGFNVLKEIEKEIKNKKKNPHIITQLSSTFYSLIPHNFGFKHMSLFIIDSLEKVKTKIRLIESLSDIVLAIKIINNNQDNLQDEEQLLASYYKQLHCDIRYIDTKEDIYPILIKYLTVKSKQSWSYTNLSLLEAYEVNREGENKRFNSKLGNRQLLWHGTRITNFVGILSQGWRIAPPEAPCSGYAFGKGLYFADMAEKSSHYCYPNNKIGWILLAEVALGNIEERTTCDSSWPATLKTNSNSALGMGSNVPSGGITTKEGVYIPYEAPKVKTNSFGYIGYNEYIVYNVNQVKLKYILKIKFN